MKSKFQEPTFNGSMEFLLFWVFVLLLEHCEQKLTYVHNDCLSTL